jgi:TRAP-type C4-dicarboxylate transport system substrate-binding protein
MKFQEVQKYITPLHYQFSLQPMIIGEKHFQKMDQNLKDILIRAGIEAQQYCVLFQMEESEKALQAMLDAGMEYSEFSDEDKMIQVAKEKVWPEYYYPVPKVLNIFLAIHFLHKNPCFEPIFFI